MDSNNDKGKKGEALALAWFIERGYQVLHQNWRSGHWEIDLIASKNNMLHFIEVKYRASGRFGLPEERVSKNKIINLVDASVTYLYRYPQWKRVQFDILSIREFKERETEYFLIEDVYVF